MRVFTTSIFFFVLLCSCAAQSEHNEIIFLESLIRKIQPEGQIVYTDRINAIHLDRAKASLKKSVIAGMSPETKMNSLILTKQERNLILDQLDQYKKSYWTENLFSNSILVGEDNMRGYMKKVYQEYSESFNNPTNSAIDKTNIIKNYSRPSVFEFSLPVYIRENSICVVFLSYYCGDPCGFDELCFYKKENDTWKKYIVVYKGDF